MQRLERTAQVFDPAGVAIQCQLGVQPRRHHAHARVRLQQQLDLAGRYRAAADHQRQLIAQIEEYRQIIHGWTLADRATIDLDGRRQPAPAALPDRSSLRARQAAP
jgi:hypothetical protein